MTIEGKVVLITGASKGIGAACAAELRRRGAKLSLVARSGDGLRAAASSDDLITACDVTDAASREHAVRRTMDRFRRIDVLINNAGVGLYSPSWQASFDDVRAMYELNVFAVIGMTQLVVPHMRKERFGTVVNISSIGGQIALPWFTLYSSTKFAICGLTDGLRMELARDGIRAMLVCPGYVKTDFQDNVLGGRPPDRLRRSKKFAVTPEECARAIARGLERDARTVTTPWLGSLFVWLHRLAPSIVEGQMIRMNERQTQQA